VLVGGDGVMNTFMERWDYFGTGRSVPYPELIKKSRNESYRKLTGEWRAIQKPIPFNKHRDSRRPQFSYFRYGYDLIRDSIVNISTKSKQLFSCFEQISLSNTGIFAMR